MIAIKKSILFFFIIIIVQSICSNFEPFEVQLNKNVPNSKHIKRNSMSKEEYTETIKEGISLTYYYTNIVVGTFEFQVVIV